MPLKLALAVAAAVAAAAGCGGGGSACGPDTAVVERVVDGDTVVLDTGQKVRYLMINAPETTNGHDDCFGQNAAQLNSDLVLGKEVHLDYDVQCEDMYGRLLAYVTVNGVEVNTLMVERGYACVLHIPPNGDDRVDEFDALEADAKAANRGLWGLCPVVTCE